MSDADPDTRLMQRIARGEPAAVRQMVSSSMPRVWALAARILRDTADAEDIAQETMIRAVRQAPRWNAGGARIDTWLHAVALNLCRDSLRKRREIATAQLPEAVDPAANAEAALIEAERSQTVAAAVRALPERQRDAVILVHYQGLSGAEAAAALGVTVEALESLLSRGRRSLRQQFRTGSRQ